MVYHYKNVGEIMKQASDGDGWQGFLTLCSKARSPEEFRRSFALFFTLEEQETLGQRYLIVKALAEGKLTQREIAKQLHVSISQITRGSNVQRLSILT